jgi:hypothetical protein
MNGMELRAIECWLRAMQCKVVLTQVNRSGRLVLLIESAAGWSAAMFHSDAVDLVTGRRTIGEIIARNMGADLAEAWPRLVTLGPVTEARVTEDR